MCGGQLLTTCRGRGSWAALVTVDSVARGLSPGNLGDVPSWVDVVSPSRHGLPLKTPCHHETSCAQKSALLTHWLLNCCFTAKTPEAPHALWPYFLVDGAGPSGGMISWDFSDPAPVFCRRYGVNTTSSTTSCLRTFPWRKWFSKVSCLPGRAGLSPWNLQAQVQPWELAAL